MRSRRVLLLGAMVVAVFATACAAPPARPVPASTAADGAQRGEPAAAGLAATAVPSTTAVSSVPDAQVTVVALNTGSSSATIQVTEGPGSSIERVVRFDGPAPPGSPPPPSHRVEGKSLTLEGCGLPKCHFAYRVTVPSGVVVVGESGSGGVVVEGAAGVALRSGSGSVSLSDVTGPAQVASGSGSVTLAGMHGDVAVEAGSGAIRGAALDGGSTSVRSGSGSIDLDFAAEQNITATTESGAVRLAVHSGRYRVAVSSGGGVESTVPDDPTAALQISVTAGRGPVEITQR